MASKAGLYARISFDPTGAREGVDRQLAELQALAERRGWDAAVYTDNDLSASQESVRRPEFERMLADADAGRLDVIAAWHTDRLTRLPTQIERLIRIVESRGIHIETIQAGLMDLSTPTGRMLARQVCAMAKYETELKGERQRAAAAARKSKGRYVGTMKLPGYDRSPGTPSLIPNADADFVRELFRRLAGGESPGAIVRAIETYPDGRPLHPSSIRNIAKNSAYRGRVEKRAYPKKGSFIVEDSWQGDWEPLVDEATWERAQRALDGRRRRVPRASAKGELLSALDAVTCAVCASTLTPRTEGGRREFYKCRRGHVRVPLARLDEFATALAVGRLASPESRDVFGSAADELEGHRAAHREAQARLDTATADYAAVEREVSFEEYRTLTRPLRDALEATERRLADAEEAAALSPRRGSEAAVREGWEAMSREQRRAVLDRLLRVRVGRAADAYGATTYRRAGIAGLDVSAYVTVEWVTE